MQPSPPRNHYAPLQVAANTFLIRQLQGEGDGPLAVYINSLVIAGEQPVIVDTGCVNNREHWLADAFSIVDPKDVRWIFVSHDDHDHIGNLVPTLEACPNATVIVNHFMNTRLSGDYTLPLHRMRWMNDGDVLDVGDRLLVAIRPPLFDSPTTRGLYDSRTGVYWGSDCFASLVTDPVDDVGDLSQGEWAESFSMTNRLNSPWYALTDAERFRQVVQRVQSLDVHAIASAHTPLIRGSHVEIAFDMLHRLPRELAPELNQSVLEQLIAQTAVGTGEVAA